MNASQILMFVSRSVITHMEPIPVPVIADIDLLLIIEHVMVKFYYIAIQSYY